MNFLFTWLSKKFRPLEYDDEYFGRLTYIEIDGKGHSYWEAERPFAPTGKPVSLFIDAPLPEHAPKAGQRAFFASVESRFPALLASAEPLMRASFEQWSGQPLSRPFADEFDLTSFSIPCTGLEEAEWEMSFDSKTDQEHLFTLSFLGTTATSVRIDA